MKKLQLLLVLFLFGCQSITEDSAPVSDYKEEQKILEKHRQFESRDLKTLSYHKKKVQVALLLPMSGKYKDLGWSLINTATMSLFDNDRRSNIELVLIDSKDTARSAEKAFDEIIDRDIKIVIGPVFSNQTDEISGDARRNNITVISLSNNRDLMDNIDEDGGVFLAGMMPEAQIDKIVSYAMQKGKYSFAAISPNNQYGLTTTTMLKKIVKDRDGMFILSELYEPNGRGLSRAVDRVVKSFSVPSQMAEGSGNKLDEDFTLADIQKTYPQVIFVPESGRNLARIARLIKQKNRDERDFKIIGTSQWDDLSTLNEANLIGSWFVAPENDEFRKFEKTYYKIYNKFPPRIASIVYDSVGAISQLVRHKKGEVPKAIDFSNYANSSNNGFEGIDGQFKYLPNGLVQRNLAVLSVGRGKFDVIERPAEEFLRY